MRLLFLNHMQNAYQSLVSRRVRSGLTVLGVTIGIASITAILALGEGASRIIDKQIDDLGGNIIIVRPGVDTDPLADLAKAHTGRDFSASTLTEKDLSHIGNTPGVKTSSPLMVLSGTIKSASETAPTGSPILASGPSLAEVSDLTIRYGQFLDDNTSRNTAVIGVQLSVDLFGTEHSLGQTFSVRGQTFTVIGVLDRINNPINYNLVDFDQAAIIHFEKGKQINQDTAQIQQINIQANSVANVPQLKEDVRQTLLTSHDGEEDFVVLSGEQIAQPSNQLFQTVAGITVAAAAISLVVGGIGIMNIMLVTVAERTREIGIRKALGASNTDIYWQFLIESLAISLIGGFAGYMFGYVIAFGASVFVVFDPAFSWQTAFSALTLSIIVGVLFGLYPAIRAARKNPIESLRQYE